MNRVLRDRWASGNHVGEARPALYAEIRQGRFFHGAEPWSGDDVDARIPGASPTRPWQATWTPTSAFVEIPNVLEVSREQDLSEGGQQRATIILDNLLMVQETGLAGIFHSIQRGYLSPWRGYKPPVRPGVQLPDAGDARNEWYEALNRNAQIVIWEGYGDELAITFSGLIDKVSLSSRPDRITVIARDFGQTLTDQRIFGWVKDRQLFSPVTFADRWYADETESVGGGADASSWRASNPPRFVCDDDLNTAWVSDDDDEEPYVEVRIPAGRYATFYVAPDRNGLEVYVSLYAKARQGGQAAPTMNGDDVGVGWQENGLGMVPGTDIPYVKHVEAVPKAGRTYKLTNDGDEWVVGDDSILRLHFRNLQVKAGELTENAGVRRLVAIKRSRKQAAKDQRWILVDDFADVVKVCLRWAGFKEWEVESTGARLKDNLLVFNASDYLADPIKKIADFTGYVFFIKEPTTNASIGIPVFRTNGARRAGNLRDGDPSGVETVRDDQLLTGMQAELDEEPLAMIIRVRGKRTTRAEGGVAWGSDPVPRFSFKYRPPWSERLAGVIKHVVHYDEKLSSNYECQIACYLLAMYEALRSATAVIEVPGYPGFEVDDQVAVYDRGSGLSTRIWVSQRSSLHRRGENTRWSSTIGGALLDTPDVVEVLADLEAAGADADEPITRVVAVGAPA